MINRLCAWCGALFSAPVYAVTLCAKCCRPEAGAVQLELPMPVEFEESMMKEKM